MEENIFILLILILAFFIRVLFLAQVPPGLAHDEIYELLNAQSLIKTGQLFPGIIPGIFSQTKVDYPAGIYGEIGSYLLIPFVKIIGLNWPWIKTPFILVNLATLFLVYLISKKLINKPVAIISSALFAINPWSIQLGRSAFETPFTYLFYLAAFYLILELKSWKILYSYIFLVLGFLTYFGAKPLLLPLVFLFGLIYYKDNPKLSLKPVIVATISVLVLFIIYSYILLNSPAGSRVSETQPPDLQTQVDLKRNLAIDSPINYFSENKLTEQLRERVQSYLGGLSPNFLFVEGQTGGAGALVITDHGPMYLIDLIFILIGFIGLSRKYLKSLLKLLSLIFIGLLPSFTSLSGVSYIFRAGLIFPTLVILSSSGIWFCLKLNGKIKNYILALIACAYFLSFVFFTHQYFLVMPIDQSDGWFLNERLASRYIELLTLQSSQTKVLAVVSDPQDISYEYLFFAKKYNTPFLVKSANDNLKKKNYSFDKVTFTNDCPSQEDLLESDKTILIERGLKCQKLSDLAISSPKDAGSYYYIYNDKLCLGRSHNRYPKVHLLNQLDIEDTGTINYCALWVTNPKQPE